MLITVVFFRFFGRCNECQGYNTGLNWCNSCNGKRFQNEFDKWTSGDSYIDEFIQQTQLTANNYAEIIEWIPFNKFDNIEYLSKGGFSIVYKGRWLDGHIRSWNHERKNWHRVKEEWVCLKILKPFAYASDLIHEVI